MRHHVWFVGCILMMGLNLSGCNEGGQQVPTSKVMGTVTFQGSPVEDGRINFESDPPGYGAAGEIKQGAFEIKDVPLASYKVTVTPPLPAPPVPGEKPADTDPADIPAKYRTPTTSDLTAEIQAGDNALTFELE